MTIANSILSAAIILIVSETQTVLSQTRFDCATRTASDGIDFASKELKLLQGQIFTQLVNAVGKSEAETLIEKWKREATQGLQDKALKVSAIPAKSFRDLFADLAKAKRFPDDRFAITNEESFEFVEIPAGEFVMGSPESEYLRKSDEKRRRVTISKSFEMARMEVTQLQWYLVMGNSPSFHSLERDSDGDYFEFDERPGGSININHPVDSLKFAQVMEFIQRLNELDPTYQYRLPTEAEWEYSARADTTSTYFFGDDRKLLANYANFDADQTQSVGLLSPNPNGLYDIYGNVWELCGDWFCRQPAGGIDPTGPREPAIDDNYRTLRVVRGGSYRSFYWNMRSANRESADEKLPDKDIGFRLVRTLK